jgi:SAM-dependent methyltransferase
MYEVLEVSLADTGRLYQYKKQDVYGADFNLKGFEYPWILSSHSWQKGEKVLDVGAAYSLLPVHIQQNYGCEMWVVDDFGMKSNEHFWNRHKSHQDHIAKYPEVKFVLERLGDPAQSSLPFGYFDVIYSASTLEHVPGDITPQVWRHMDMLLKPGGQMLCALDLDFPSNDGLLKICLALVFDTFYNLFPERYKLRRYQLTPGCYAKLVFQTLGISYKIGRGLSVLNMIHNPETLAENYAIGFNRIIKDNRSNYHYRRMGALLLRMRKV